MDGHADRLPREALDGFRGMSPLAEDARVMLEPVWSASRTAFNTHDWEQQTRAMAVCVRCGTPSTWNAADRECSKYAPDAAAADRALHARSTRRRKDLGWIPSVDNPPDVGAALRERDNKSGTSPRSAFRQWPRGYPCTERTYEIHVHRTKVRLWFDATFLSAANNGQGADPRSLIQQWYDKALRVYRDTGGIPDNNHGDLLDYIGTWPGINAAQLINEGRPFSPGVMAYYVPFENESRVGGALRRLMCLDCCEAEERAGSGIIHKPRCSKKYGTFPVKERGGEVVV